MESKEKNTVDYKKILEKIEEDLLNDDIIKDNKLHFMYENELYCVEMPTQRVLTLADMYKNQKYVELIQLPNTITEKKLIKVLKENQDIDIEQLREEYSKLEKELKELYLKLVFKKDHQEEKIKSIKEELKIKKQNMTDINFEISKYLSSSVETQVKNFYMEFLTANCTKKYNETKEGDKTVGEYINVWDNYDEYQDCNSPLRYEAVGYLTHLMLNIGA